MSTTLWKIDACPMTYYTVAPTKEGYEIVWPTEGQVYFARLDESGVPQSPIEVKTPGSSGMRTGMLALPTASGDTLVAWKKSGQLSWQLERKRPAGWQSRIGKKSRQRRGRRPCTGRPFCTLSLESLSPLIQPGDQSPRYVEHFFGSVRDQRISALVGRESDSLPFEDGPDA